MNNSTAACPAVGSTGLYTLSNNPTVDHIACYGGYQTGVAGDNTSAALRFCCNSTVVVTRNNDLNRAYGGNNCFFYCNVSRSPEYAFNEDSAYDFWKIQQCVKNSDVNHTDAENPDDYRECFPKLERSNAAISLSFQPLAILGFGLIAMVTAAVVLV